MAQTSPSSRFLEEHRGRFPLIEETSPRSPNLNARPVVCEISDITGHYAAARAGVGVAGLPCFLGDADDGLQRLAFDGEGFSREIWLVVHRDLKRSPPIRAVMDFLIEVIGSTRALQQG